MATDVRTAIRRNTLAGLVNALALVAPGTAAAEIAATHERVVTLTDRYWAEGAPQSVLERLHAEEAQLEHLVLVLAAQF